MSYIAKILKSPTPQSEPLPGAAQVRNSAGGYAFPVTDWTRLDRFLVLGSEGGSYYASARTLTQDNAEAVLRCIAADGVRTVARIVEISDAGRAPKNDPAIFALALAAARGDAATRQAALAALPAVCRTGTHLFHFAELVDGLRGWGRGLRRAVAAWYNARPARDLAYGAVKYQSRDGWSHRDLLRLARPSPASEQHGAIYHWITRGWDWVGEQPHPDQALVQLWAYERAKRASSSDEVARLVCEYRLPREAVPTRWLAEPAVWEALLEEMPLTALLRNLATLTRVGLLAPNGEATRRVADRLGDAVRLRKARVHPVAVLAALKTYAQGRGERGKHTWEPVPQIAEALDGAFYAAFGSVAPTGKRWVLALDVSGSMATGTVAGVSGLTPRAASAAMALVTAATEPQHVVVGFTAARGGSGSPWGGGDPGLTRLHIGLRVRLETAVEKVSDLPFGATDCALPMLPPH